ncbi:hypothetical protein FM117_04370 [Micrococcus luteus Mu201]|nr:hypothetical protein FM117_04370 [Micrococcus luteus Mu201]
MHDAQAVRAVTGQVQGIAGLEHERPRQGGDPAQLLQIQRGEQRDPGRARLWFIHGGEGQVHTHAISLPHGGLTAVKAVPPSPS